MTTVKELRKETRDLCATAIKKPLDETAIAAAIESLNALGDKCISAQIAADEASLREKAKKKFMTVAKATKG